MTITWPRAKRSSCGASSAATPMPSLLLFPAVLFVRFDTPACAGTAVGKRTSGSASLRGALPQWPSAAPTTVLQADHRGAARRCGSGVHGPVVAFAAGDRLLLVAAYWRTNLTLRQLSPRFEVSKPAIERGQCVQDRRADLLAGRQPGVAGHRGIAGWRRTARPPRPGRALPWSARPRRTARPARAPEQRAQRHVFHRKRFPGHHRIVDRNRH